LENLKKERKALFYRLAFDIIPFKTQTKYLKQYNTPWQKE